MFRFYIFMSFMTVQLMTSSFAPDAHASAFRDTGADSEDELMNIFKKEDSPIPKDAVLPSSPPPSPVLGAVAEDEKDDEVARLTQTMRATCLGSPLEEIIRPASNIFGDPKKEAIKRTRREMEAQDTSSSDDEDYGNEKERSLKRSRPITSQAIPSPSSSDRAESAATEALSSPGIFQLNLLTRSGTPKRIHASAPMTTKGRKS